MTSSSTDPVLTEEELDLLLESTRLEDFAGVAPGDDDWVGTYDLNRAAAEGWRWKAGKAAARFEFTADGSQFKRDQVMANCEKMIKMFSGKVISSAQVISQVATSQESEDADDDL